jgi:YesN/AraC family two-component response regulator
MIRVVIADDQRLIRAGFRALLEAEPDIDVVAEAATGADAVARVREHRPDVALMDIRMPQGDGLGRPSRSPRTPASPARTSSSS